MLLLLSVCLFLFFSEIAARLTMKPVLLDYIDFDNASVAYNLTENSLIYEKGGVCLYYESIGNDGQHYCKSSNYEANKNINTFRIAVLGDSFTEGGHVLPNETFSSQLEKMLNERSGKYDFQVYDFGVRGHNTQQELIMLNEMALKHNPDVVILQYHENDIMLDRIMATAYLEGTNLSFLVDPDIGFVIYENDVIPVTIPLPLEINNFLVKFSHFYRFLSKTFYNIGEGFSEKGKEERLEGIKVSFESIKEMKEITEKNNISFFIIELPGVQIKDNCIYQADIHEKLRNLTIELKIPYVDFCDYHPPDYLKLRSKGGDDHYNAEGHELISEVLYENLEKYSLIP
jgi:lysophospholipase L1-like esterase